MTSSTETGMSEGYNVFISWSGPRSRSVARALRDWLPMLLHASKPWMSETDTDKGTRWRDEVTRALDTMRAGIICLTPENLGSQGLLFEAGALSKTREQKTRIWTFLLGVEPEDLMNPLEMFQETRADKEDIRKLVHSINKDLAAPVADKLLDSLFDRLWPELEKQLAAILISSPADAVTEEERMFSHIRRLIDSSGLPMYLTDRKFVVLHCNS